MSDLFVWHCVRLTLLLQRNPIGVTRRPGQSLVVQESCPAFVPVLFSAVATEKCEKWVPLAPCRVMLAADLLVRQ